MLIFDIFVIIDISTSFGKDMTSSVAIDGPSNVSKSIDVALSLNCFLISIS